ncbi:MAG: hypothetical protein ACI4A5_06130 [Hominilimicola sp.]
MTGFSSVTVQPDSEETVTVTITLDNTQLEELEQVMTNGFFIDGKITLSSSGGDNCDVCIPFSGFYGDWNSTPIIDTADLGNEMNFSLDGKDYSVKMQMQNTDDGPVLYMSENTDEQFADKKFLMNTQARRNSYMTMSEGDKTIIDNKFINKVAEDMEPLTLDLVPSQLAEVAKNNGRCCPITGTRRKSRRILWILR